MSDDTTVVNGGTVTADDLNADEAAHPEVEQTATEPQPDYPPDPAVPPEPQSVPGAQAEPGGIVGPEPAPPAPPPAPEPQHRILAMFEGLAQALMHLSQAPANSGLAGIAQMILGHVHALKPEAEAPPPVNAEPLTPDEQNRLNNLRQAQQVMPLPQALAAELNALAEREAVQPEG